MKTTIIVFIVLLISGLMPRTVFSASDGDLGTDSQGAMDVGIEIFRLVKIAGLEDLIVKFPKNTNDININPPTGRVNFCVYSNVDVKGTYSITATGSGNNGSFSLKNGENYIDYKIYFTRSYERNDSNVSNHIELKPGEEAKGVGGGSSQAVLECSSENAYNATLWAMLGITDLHDLQAGDYTGTVTLMVAPD